MKKLIVFFLLCVITQGALAQTKYQYAEGRWNGTEVVYTNNSTDYDDYDVLSHDKYGSGGGLAGIGSGASTEYKFFVVTNNYTIKNGLTVSGTCKVILCDGATLTVKGNGIEVLEDSKLIIYSQTVNGNGKLIVIGENDDNAGIGSKIDNNPGAIEIHGGYVEAHAGKSGAGIGGGNRGDGSNVTIYGGTVKAYGGENAAGIGAGRNGANWSNRKTNTGHLIVYGGDVYAEGGRYGAGIGTGINEGRTTVNGIAEFFGGKVEAKGGHSGAGIGGGRGHNCMHVKIHGGEIIARGGMYGAGIGGGINGNGGDASIESIIIIREGIVKAYGGEYGAGIGGGQNGSGGTVQVYGGDVFADGGLDAAGIGSGEEGSEPTNGGSLLVEGGKVFADGTGWGAGIGGGEDSDGADVTIKGGVVEAYAGSDAGEKNGSAIGSEDGDDHRGSLRLDDKLMVHAGQTPEDGKQHLFPYDTRVSACYFRPYCKIEVCNHEGHTYTINGTDWGGTHTMHCPHCLYRPEELHDYVGGVCKICGAQGTTFGVYIYMPNTSGSEYVHTQTFQIGANKELMLPNPPVDRIPDGMAFVGWVKSETDNVLRDNFFPHEGETLLPAETEITITNTTYLVARYDLVFGEVATGIGSIQQSTPILQQTGWYTLDGRRLDGSPTTKGIYIHDGKKIVIK
ncbi:MAG: hypothetical protein J6T43_08525 [Prevotella sp.]|nr:hypothetical protein [Prevotella sp.]